MGNQSFAHPSTITKLSYGAGEFARIITNEEMNHLSAYRGKGWFHPATAGEREMVVPLP